jgi:hypothetical protein
VPVGIAATGIACTLASNRIKDGFERWMAARRASSVMIYQRWRAVSKR